MYSTRKFKKLKSLLSVTAIAGTLGLSHEVKADIPFTESFSGTGLCSELGSPPTDLSAATTVTSMGHKACFVTPSTYKINLYSMAICKEDPFSGVNNIDTTSCFFTLNRKQSTEVDFGSKTTITLPSSDERPPDGEYPHMVVVMGNTITIAGSVQSGGNTYYTDDKSESQSHGGTFNPGLTAAKEVTHDLSKRGFGPNCVYHYQRTLPNSAGVVRAVLTNSALTTQSSQGSDACKGTISRVVGTYKPQNSLNITPSTNGLEIQFNITGYGLQAETHGTWSSSNSSANQPSWAYAGDFRPSFTTY